MDSFESWSRKMIKRNDLKCALKDTIQLFLQDDVDYLLFDKMSDEQWNKIINSLKNELNIVGIKVN